MTESNCQGPKVSVLMVTYNHVNFIEQAIESVLMQETDFQYELVIGEDCSTDDTREIVKNYAEKYPDKIKTLLHPENVGMQQNFLKVLEVCHGDYVALLEGDDYWTDTLKLQKQVVFLEKNPDFSICFHKIKILENDELKDDYITTVPDDVSTIDDLSKSYYIHTCSLVFRNYKTKIIGRNFLLAPFADYYIQIMCAQFGNIFLIDNLMGVYRVHKDSVWSSTTEKSRRLKILSGFTCILLDLSPEFIAAQKNIKERIVLLFQEIYTDQEELFKMIREFPTHILVAIITIIGDHIELIGIKTSVFWKLYQFWHSLKNKNLSFFR